jgi:hypothetical protein
MQAAEQADQQRLLPSVVVYGDLPIARDRFEHNVRRAIAWLQRTFRTMF